jgi:hypothetical protein
VTPPKGSFEERQAQLVTELTGMRRHLWTLISKGKMYAHFLPVRERADLIEAMTEAEKALAR